MNKMAEATAREVALLAQAYSDRAGKESRLFSHSQLARIVAQLAAVVHQVANAKPEGQGSFYLCPHCRTYVPENVSCRRCSDRPAEALFTEGLERLCRVNGKNLISVDTSDPKMIIVKIAK